MAVTTIIIIIVIIQTIIIALQQIKIIILAQIISQQRHKFQMVYNINASSDTSNAKTNSNSTPPDARQVLKEAVDAVVNSFTKHTQGYGRGE